MAVKNIMVPFHDGIFYLNKNHRCKNRLDLNFVKIHRILPLNIDLMKNL